MSLWWPQVFTPPSSYALCCVTLQCPPTDPATTTLDEVTPQLSPLGWGSDGSRGWTLECAWGWLWCTLLSPLGHGVPAMLGEEGHMG